MQTRPKAFLWSQVASETVFITCLSSPLCASVFAVVPQACGPSLGLWHQRLWRLPGVGWVSTCRSEGSVGLEIFPQLGVPGIQAWPEARYADKLGRRAGCSRDPALLTLALMSICD